MSKSDKNPARWALVVVDMLNDFIQPDGALPVGAAGRRIVPAIRRRIDEARAEGAAVIYVADQHAPHDAEFDRWPPHAVRGTPGAEVIAELDRRKTDYHVPKTRYSAFFRTGLEAILRRERVERVELAGVMTSICVLMTAMDLRNRDIPVTVHKSTVADPDPEAHRFALKYMSKVLGVEVV